jgi:hypothetical protein
MTMTYRCSGSQLKLGPSFFFLGGVDFLRIAPGLLRNQDRPSSAEPFFIGGGDFSSADEYVNPASSADPDPARFECDIFLSANLAADIRLLIAFEAFFADPEDFFLFCEESLESESVTIAGGADGGPVPSDGEIADVTISTLPVFITRERSKPDFRRDVGAEVVGLFEKSIIPDIELPGMASDVVAVDECRVLLLLFFDVIVVVEVSLNDVVGDGVVVVADAEVSSSGSIRVF